MEATVTESTPVTTTEAAPAAPATSAPASTPTTSERPSSFKEAFERVAAAQDPAAASPTEGAATAPDATSQPDGASSPSTEKKGPIPFDVHTKALENARVKAEQAAQAKLEQEYGWAKQITPDQLTQFATIAQRISTDPIGHIRELVAELQTHPVYGPQLRSEAARTMASGRQATNLDPDVAIEDAEGRVVGKTYSAEKVSAIVRQAVNDALAKEVAPLKEAHTQQQAAEYARAQRAEVESKADALLARAAKWDGFSEHQAQIAEALAAHPEYSLQDAYLDVLHGTILPSRSSREQQKVLDSLKQKAAGATAGSGVTAAPIKKPQTVSELAALMRQLDGAA